MISCISIKSSLGISNHVSDVIYRNLLQRMGDRIKFIPVMCDCSIAQNALQVLYFTIVRCEKQAGKQTFAPCDAREEEKLLQRTFNTGGDYFESSTSLTPSHVNSLWDISLKSFMLQLFIFFLWHVRSFSPPPLSF